MYNFSEYSERFETEHKVASKITKGGEIGSDTNVGEQRGVDHEEQQFPQSNMIAVKKKNGFLISYYVAINVSVVFLNEIYLYNRSSQRQSCCRVARFIGRIRRIDSSV